MDPNFVLVFGPSDYSTLHGGGTYEYALLGGQLPDFTQVKNQSCEYKKTWNIGVYNNKHFYP